MMVAFDLVPDHLLLTVQMAMDYCYWVALGVCLDTLAEVANAQKVVDLDSSVGVILFVVENHYLARYQPFDWANSIFEEKKQTNNYFSRLI